MTFHTLRSPKPFNRNAVGISPAIPYPGVQIGILGIEFISLKVYRSAAVAVNAPSHRKFLRKLNPVHLLHFAMACLAFDASCINVL